MYTRPICLYGWVQGCNYFPYPKFATGHRLVSVSFFYIYEEIFHWLVMTYLIWLYCDWKLYFIRQTWAVRNHIHCNITAVMKCNITVNCRSVHACFNYSLTVKSVDFCKTIRRGSLWPIKLLSNMYMQIKLFSILHLVKRVHFSAVHELSWEWAVGSCLLCIKLNITMLRNSFHGTFPLLQGQYGTFLCTATLSPAAYSLFIIHTWPCTSQEGPECIMPCPSYEKKVMCNFRTCLQYLLMYITS